MTTIRQGHLYRYGHSMRVIALSTGERDIRVLVLDEVMPRICTVQPKWLTPLPMRYHGGHVPGE